MTANDSFGSSTRKLPINRAYAYENKPCLTANSYCREDCNTKRMRRSERRTSCNLHVSVNTAIPIICVEPLFVFWSSEKPSMKLQYWYKAYFSYDPILKP